MIATYIYGLAGIGTFINVWAWAHLLSDRLKVQDRPRFGRDLYIAVRVGLALGSLSLCALFVRRVVDALLGTAPLVADAYTIVFVAGLALAEVAYLHAARLGGRRWPVLIYAVAVAVWTAFIVGLPPA
ncbi:hypothetical protein [Sphingomonas sp.]|uniref:hypothetical protein n=1 Tax=Sphingomonas sp. TaxID=28214 RepID=UPI002D7F3151|nr:hypothetical protein [Sphingomonas sp.]HEU0045067.1 hypothetical protein [Sphingomonas sp.]